MLERVNSLINKYKNALILKLKFGMSSIVATLTDYILFFLLVTFQGGVLSAFWGNMASASVGMLINFVLQKKFVFEYSPGTCKLRFLTYFLGGLRPPRPPQ